MLLYEFVCNSCGYEFEELIRDGKTSVSCPKCQSGDVKRLISAVKKQGNPSGQSASACAPGGGFS